MDVDRQQLLLTVVDIDAALDSLELTHANDDDRATPPPLPATTTTPNPSVAIRPYRPDAEPDDRTGEPTTGASSGNVSGLFGSLNAYVRCPVPASTGPSADDASDARTPPAAECPSTSSAPSAAAPNASCVPDNVLADSSSTHLPPPAGTSSSNVSLTTTATAPLHSHDDTVDDCAALPELAASADGQPTATVTGQQPVGFDSFAATMDDVSDGELDGYLQELDADGPPISASTQTDAGPSASDRSDSAASDDPGERHAPSSDDGPSGQCADAPGTDCTPSAPPPPPPIDDGRPTAAIEALEQPLADERPRYSPIATQPLLGTVQPYWIPDVQAPVCMECAVRFSLLRRRHHCRACGRVLCGSCCALRAHLAYMTDGQASGRVCAACSQQLADEAAALRVDQPVQPADAGVPVGVLKRSSPQRQPDNARKSVMFSDGIAPGCGDPPSTPSPVHDRPRRRSAAGGQANGWPMDMRTRSFMPGDERGLPPLCPDERYAPLHAMAAGDRTLGVASGAYRGDVTNDRALVERLLRTGETLRFALQRNLYVYVRIVKLECCVNKTVINYTSAGLLAVGHDECLVLLEIDPATESHLPTDVLRHFNALYLQIVGSDRTAQAAIGGDSPAAASDLGFSSAGVQFGEPDAPSVAESATVEQPPCHHFLGHREHGGFLYVRPTFQCMQTVCVPDAPYRIGVLVHRWEVPWARIFPLRLALRLGALHRYYPCPHVSVRGRNAVYAELAQTIVNFLADFRTYTYTLAAVPGMRIHMETGRMTVRVPRNRYAHVQQALNNSSEHILALAGNFSPDADGHLVCIQNMDDDEDGTPDGVGTLPGSLGSAPATGGAAYAYWTQAVNIQGRQRRVTGVSFLVLNGALKSSANLSGKCSIVEDGIMVQVLPAKMQDVQKALRDMRDVDIACGPADGSGDQPEMVRIQWTDDDRDFNLGVTSPIDGRSMAGVPSIRVHRIRDHTHRMHFMRWTEVFVLQSDEQSKHNKDPIDVSKLAEQLALAAARALVDFVDLLATSGWRKIGLRATLHTDNVCYEAGSGGKPLGPLYMNALDEELIHTLHRCAVDLQPEQPIVVELIFHILDE